MLGGVTSPEATRELGSDVMCRSLSLVATSSPSRSAEQQAGSHHMQVRAQCPTDLHKRARPRPETTPCAFRHCQCRPHCQPTSPPGCGPLCGRGEHWNPPPVADWWCGQWPPHGSCDARGQRARQVQGNDAGSCKLGEGEMGGSVLNGSWSGPASQQKPILQGCCSQCYRAPSMCGPTPGPTP